MIELFKEVHKLGLTCYIDANGFFDYESLLPLIDETDKFLFDIKGLGHSLNDLCFSDSLGKISHLAKNASKRFGVEAEHLENLELLLKRGKIEEVRFVYLKNFYDTSKVIDESLDIMLWALGESDPNNLLRAEILNSPVSSSETKPLIKLADIRSLVDLFDHE